MKKILITTAFLIITPIMALAANLSGRILLQVEEHGEAWYVKPENGLRYYLGRPLDAFNLMKKFGLGINEADLKKIPIGLLTDSAKDSDQDGLSDPLEDAIGTDKYNSDSDADGYADKTEVQGNYNPLGAGKINFDPGFSDRQAGKILIQTEKNGEAWYVDPVKNQRHFLGRPDNAFAIMRNLGLGITNANLYKITAGEITSNSLPTDENDIIYKAADAIRTGRTDEALEYFSPEIKERVKYSLDHLDASGRLAFGNILSSAKITNETESKKVYAAAVYFSLGGYDTVANFTVEKNQTDEWLITGI